MPTVLKVTRPGKGAPAAATAAPAAGTSAAATAEVAATRRSRLPGRSSDALAVKSAAPAVAVMTPTTPAALLRSRPVMLSRRPMVLCKWQSQVPAWQLGAGRSARGQKRLPRRPGVLQSSSLRRRPHSCGSQRRHSQRQSSQLWRRRHLSWLTTTSPQVLRIPIRRAQTYLQMC